MGIFEKRRFRNFLQYVQEFDENDPKTWKGMDPNQSTATQLYEKFSLDANTQDFTGHALALYLNDEWVHTYTWTHGRDCPSKNTFSETKDNVSGSLMLSSVGESE